mmetsp:Transcript_10256/g.15489  ORF Transcript_10256/g.15489 Transcript_10256/m.15489 type:complete len:231 (+) Transcript_10256:376-1068(+)
MLKLLKLLLSVSLLRVFKSERIVTGFSLSNTKITWLVVLSLFLDDVDTTDLKVCHEKEDLKNGKSRYLGESLEGVEVAVGIIPGPVVSWEGSEKSWGKESDNGNLGNTSMDELGFTVPGEVSDLSITSLKSSEPRSYRYGRESERIESNISKHGSVKGGGGSGKGKGKGRSGVGPSISRRGSSGGLWWSFFTLLLSKREGHGRCGKGSSRAGKGNYGGGGDLHLEYRLFS